MKKNIILSLMILTTAIYSYGQEDEIFLELNYNTFSHNHLKGFQQELLKDIPEIPLSVNDDFPSYLGVSLGYNFSQFNTSLFLGFNSTGGKISYSDYSGVLRITQGLKAYSFGGEYKIPLSPDTNSGFSLGLRGFGMLTNLNLESYSQILETSSSENIKFLSINLGIGSRLIYEHPLSFFNVKATLGYDYTFGGSLKFQENTEFHLENNNEEQVKTNWSGLRLSLGIEVPI